MKNLIPVPTVLLNQLRVPQKSFQQIIRYDVNIGQNLIDIHLRLSARKYFGIN